jgi:hypothetical protein
LAEHCFGYGQWRAPYWFVGLEPGGDELNACVRAWNELGKGELLDAQDGHKGHECRDDLFGPKASIQHTWQKLIWLIFGYEDIEPTPKATLHYQKMKLGRSDGNTALIEISCLPAKHNGVEIPRELFRPQRITKIREQLVQNAPRFVVFYSPDPKYREAWELIAGSKLERDKPVLIGSIACIVTYHPNGEWTKAYWSDMGRTLRRLAV